MSCGRVTETVMRRSKMSFKREILYDETKSQNTHAVFKSLLVVLLQACELLHLPSICGNRNEKKIGASFGVRVERGREWGFGENRQLKQNESHHLLDRPLKHLLLVIVAIGLHDENHLFRLLLVTPLNHETSDIAQSDCGIGAQCILEVRYLRESNIPMLTWRITRDCSNSTVTYLERPPCTPYVALDAVVHEHEVGTVLSVTQRHFTPQQRSTSNSAPHPSAARRTE